MNVLKFKNLSKEKKAALVFVLATAITSGINMLTTPLFTRLMPVESFGMVQLYTTWYQVIWVFATFSVANSVINVGFHDFPNDRMGFLSSSLGLSTFCTFILTIIIFLIKPWFEIISGFNSSLIILMILSFIFLNSTQLWICVNRYELKYRTVFWVMTLSGILSSLLSLLLVKNTTENFVEVRLWSQYIIPLLIGLIIFVYIVVKGRKFYNKQYWLFILIFNLPLLVHYLSQFVLSSSDRLMISYYTNEEDVAIYSLAYLVSNILMVFFMPINSVIVPKIHSLVDRNNYAEIQSFLYKLLFPVSGIIILVSLFSPEIILILGGEEYIGGVNIVPIISASTIFTIIYLYVANIEFLFHKSSRIAYMTIIAAVINIFLNAVFIPILGFEAAAYTTLFSYIVYAWLHIYNMHKLIKYNILSIKKLALFSLILISTCVIIIFLMDFNIVRYLIAGVLLIITILRIKLKVGLN